MSIPAPSAPMLREFELIASADPSQEGWLDRMSDAICELFTDDCILEDTSTSDVVHGLSELWDFCHGFFGGLSNIRIVPNEIINTDHVSTMVLDISGDHTGELMGHAPTGRRISYTAVAIYRCNEDNTKVRHETLAYDTGWIESQLR
ncbi:ester cyclase [Microbacterium sp. LS_15]|uniref:ester cyclase n=1 Tax=Microbacterium sp. LS_15 TaxID=3055790 RepID=UPI0035C1A258